MEITEVVETRLTSLGYTVTAADASLITLVIARSEEKLKNEVNQASVPDGLFYMWADLAAGLFLQDRKKTGTLTGFDFTAPAKSISEGDTSVSYAISDADNPGASFEALIASLTALNEFELARYRRLTW